MLNKFLKVLLLFTLTLTINQLAAQIEGKLTLLPDNVTYQVSIIPTENISPPLSFTSSAQITFRTVTGGFNPTNFTNVVGSWTQSSKLINPAGAPGFDFYSYTIDDPLTSLSYVAGQEIILFTFRNGGNCTGVVELVDGGDPFVASQNIANGFVILKNGPAVNSYDGSVNDVTPADCPDQMDAIISPATLLLACNGQTTSVVARMDGGSAPYTVDWTNTTKGTNGSTTINDQDGSTTFTDVDAGRYNYKVTDAAGIEIEKIFTINEPEALALSFTEVNTSCPQSTDGRAVANVSGGNTPYSYTWNHDATLNAATANDLGIGIYELTITDDNGCTTDGDILIEAAGFIEAKGTPMDVSCFGENDGELTINANGPNQPFTYQWEGGGTSGSSASNNGLGAGKYKFTVTDASGNCTVIDSVEIIEPAELALYTTVVPPDCTGETLGGVVIDSLENSGGAFTVSFEGSNFISQSEFSNLEGGVYNLTVEDANGCRVSEDVFVPDPMPISIDLGEDLIVPLGENVELSPTYFPQSEVNFAWEIPTDTLSCQDCPNPQFMPLQTMQVKVTITDDTGDCVATSQQMIFVEETEQVYIPNAFSPNLDGVNDYFSVFTGNDVREIKEIRIANRWGDIVFEKNGNIEPNNPNAGWDGKFQGKVLEPGIYLYQAVVEFINGKTVNYTGDLNLIR